ncbi:MAG: tryptophanase [Clostridiales bacterium]|jgi:tryptophanase|nr:tryptophanase [Clostridiales bacterium]MCI2160786.1 tryptophanase [Oscillospiraceae bacterium]MCI1962378.1 tryptophanase [Clostridiales bacterium]MCI2022810.1 tryptophanase [Clostridiales bacterium]MCI2027207.1 tryptophanase [Clostridiales bacterium]
MKYPLNVATPKSFAYVKRNIPSVTVEQRERALKATHYNEFAFPAGLLTVDMLSDSGTTAMTDVQWSAMFLGDESYGRNKGYYVLLDTFRDIFERGGEKNWKKIIDLVRTDCTDIDKMMDEVYLCEYEGGLFNGGAAQMERPNAFLIQQGRAAESVLMEIVKNVLAKRYPGKVFTIPSNGHFDTTEGNIKQMGSIPRNLYNKDLLFEVPEGGRYAKNPFKGNMDTKRLEQLIKTCGPENVPLIFTCITNNPVCGQPVSMANLREVSRIAHKYNIPYIFDAARWAENAYFIKTNEDGYADKSIAEIATEMFKYCDGFTMSAKKDGHANMGGMLAFRDKGRFWKNFSEFNPDGTVKTDVGVLLKVKQISSYGNDSYGGMSGRDIMALAAGLYESCKFDYLTERVDQCNYLAEGFYKAGVKGVVIPAGGHGVYINMDAFFDGKRGHEDFAGEGFSLELIRRYGIRVSELGDYSMEYDLKTPEQQAEVCNVVRFAINRSQLSQEHLDYVIAAVKALYEDRENIPNMRITWGHNLPMRHFHAFLEPYAPSKK